MIVSFFLCTSSLGILSILFSDLFPFRYSPFSSPSTNFYSDTDIPANPSPSPPVVRCATVIFAPHDHCHGLLRRRHPARLHHGHNPLRRKDDLIHDHSTHSTPIIPLEKEKDSQGPEKKKKKERERRWRTRFALCSSSPFGGMRRAEVVGMFCFSVFFFLIFSCFFFFL